MVYINKYINKSEFCKIHPQILGLVFEGEFFFCNAFIVLFLLDLYNPQIQIHDTL